MTRVQVLAAAVGAKADLSLPEKMNISTDALIGNQCSEDAVTSLEWRGCEIKYYSFAERGVGLNRNNTLMRATGEICLIADDMRYADGYAALVEDAFDRNPRADVIIFNVTESKGHPFVIRKPFKVGRLNYMRFATFRLAFRTESLRRRGVAFNLSFGGGAKYQHGEDSLFLSDCLSRGLRVIALPVTIGELLYDRDSTWFRGFNERYFLDQGALYAAISRKCVSFLCLQDVIRHRKKYRSHGGILRNYRVMKQGARAFLTNK